MVSIELLIPAVISYCTSPPSYMMLSLACDFVRLFGHPSLVM
jgi:hypothetical protein